MSRRSKHHRSKQECKPQGIMACEWCDTAFARQMHDGIYCNEVCRYQHREQMALDGNPRALTAEQLVEAVERESAE